MDIKPVSKIIAEHRKQKGWLQQNLCDELNRRGIDIKVKAISAWESGLSQPPLGTFFVLCDIFNIIEIYEEVFGYKPANKLSFLNEEGKSRANEYIDYLISTGKYAKDDFVVPVITDISEVSVASAYIKLYDVRVSAGTGNFLDGDSYEEVIRDNSIPATADYGVKIAGDSMEPMFQDGQVVWVKKQDTIEHGEIGIFLLDGQVYCKKFRNNAKGPTLLSLNKKYKPISLSGVDGFKVLGKVESI